MIVDPVIVYVLVGSTGPGDHTLLQSLPDSFLRFRIIFEVVQDLFLCHALGEVALLYVVGQDSLNLFLCQTARSGLALLGIVGQDGLKLFLCQVFAQNVVLHIVGKKLLNCCGQVGNFHVAVVVNSLKCCNS